ncbi:PQ loop repeat protein [Ophiobolus disseminans]|uniref:PQ loop repeat protein n=1 Tax=Ophiobolus disseminans TaxID=1469910 RepID=A0A6A7A2G1_9PLEO|nr:PQ loop repeat protein [Ophiobolus disseminans]
MFPPSQGLRLDIDAISQIFGSISIACWIVVFSPQIIENWRRNSAEGLSVVFIVVWLLGDFFNIIGAVLQGVLPTMIILAVYYTLADIVLLLQCFWYKGFTLRDTYNKPGNETDSEATTPSERSPLLSAQRHPADGSSFVNGNGHEVVRPRISDIDRRHSSHSQGSFRERYLSIDGTHLSPVTPLHDDPTHKTPPRPQPMQSTVRTVVFNLGTIILVIAAGIFGWWLSASRAPPHDDTHDPSSDSTLHFNFWGQISGYVCAALYLGSRVPQLLLNYRRKSTEGISMLFFLFACLGNLTYVLSILVYKPRCGSDGICGDEEGRRVYGKYVAVNASWLLGSFGTLLLDAGVFVQYFMYRKEEESDSEDE